MKRYKLGIFLQGDDYYPFEAELGRGGPEAGIDYLKQWEPDDYSDMTLSEPPHNPYDIVYTSNDGQYVLSYRPSYCYAGLCRIVEV